MNLVILVACFTLHTFLYLLLRLVTYISYLFRASVVIMLTVQ